jgi:hypothetical protein
MILLRESRVYLDRRGRRWVCVAVAAGDRGAPVAICRDDLGVAQLFGADGRALATGARSWFDLVCEAQP